MKKIHFDSEGLVTGFYDASIHQSIPTPNIEITDEQWQQCLSEPDNYKVDVSHKMLINVTPPKPTIDELIEQAQLSVKKIATTARATFTENADQYKLAGWNNKSQRAQRYIDNIASDDDIAILQKEAELRGNNETIAELVDSQLAKAQLMSQAIAIIDGLESSAFIQLNTLTTEQSINEVVAKLPLDINAELNQLTGA